MPEKNTVAKNATRKRGEEERERFCKWVRLMISKLKQYRYLEKELKDLERRISRTKKQLSDIEDIGTVKDSVTGGSGGIQHFLIEGVPMRDYTLKKTRLILQLNQYENDEAELTELTQSVLDYINSIENPRDRLICKYYYLDGRSQEWIAQNMHYAQQRISQVLREYVF